jgi:glycosyltransferase involved in cell wall biosynthesis
MGSMNRCICHDNQFNREVLQNCGIYFKDSSAVDECIESVENNSLDWNSMSEAALSRVENYFNWKNIAAKYNQIFLESFGE